MSLVVDHATKSHNLLIFFSAVNWAIWLLRHKMRLLLMWLVRRKLLRITLSTTFCVLFHQIARINSDEIVFHTILTGLDIRGESAVSFSQGSAWSILFLMSGEKIFARCSHKRFMWLQVKKAWKLSTGSAQWGHSFTVFYCKCLSLLFVVKYSSRSFIKLSKPLWENGPKYIFFKLCLMDEGVMRGFAIFCHLCCNLLKFGFKFLFRIRYVCLTVKSFIGRSLFFSLIFKRWSWRWGSSSLPKTALIVFDSLIRSLEMWLAGYILNFVCVRLFMSIVLRENTSVW